MKLPHRRIPHPAVAAASVPGDGDVRLVRRGRCRHHGTGQGAMPEQFVPVECVRKKATERGGIVPSLAQFRKLARLVKVKNPIVC